ncbi:hypothetical protein [Sulfobacillus sp. hq2]|uniref:hypothetical protein n=1 Tax=Sulfobacillus TaxID=28033 RepID=UPI000CD02615|nr:hypothetical protein [Sulfobacillus sp. hq2]POB12094.1 hypothetical protein CO251_01385 [Sulfobacillus sp. hq2]
MHEDNPAENRQTAGHALLSALAATFGGGSSIVLIRSAVGSRSLSLPHIFVLALTTLGSALLLSLIWGGHPDRQWPVTRHILWISVLAVATTVFATMGWPWFWHWAFPPRG